MAKSESDRYPSATAMLRDLRALSEMYEATSGEDDITQPMTPVDPLAVTTVQPALRTDSRSEAKRPELPASRDWGSGCGWSP